MWTVPNGQAQVAKLWSLAYSEIEGLGEKHILTLIHLVSWDKYKITHFIWGTDEN